MAFARAPGPQKYVFVTVCQRFRSPRARVTNAYPDGRLELRVRTRKVLAVLNGLAHAAEDVLPVRAAEHGAGTEQRQRVIFSAGVVNSNVPEHVLGDLLREVDVDAKEVGYNPFCQMKTAVSAGAVLTISLSSLDLLEQGLEPTERGSVTANPEELDTLKGTERALLLTIPDMLEDGREGRDTCGNA